MEKEELLKYIDHPLGLNEYSLSELRALLNKYPYFQTAHQLFLLNLKNINDPRFKEFLKYSAVYIKEREKFLRLINYLYSHDDKTVVKKDGDSLKNPGVKEKEDSENQGTANKKEKPDQKRIPQAAKEKKEGIRKDKDFSTAYLKKRISDTLSVQKGEGTSERKDDSAGEMNSDFFILDKASQVEEKMSRKVREKYEKEEQDKEKEDAINQQSASSDSFELDSSEQGREQKGPRKFETRRNVGSEYFTEKDFRENLGNTSKERQDLIGKFIKETPELKNVTPYEDKIEDISLPSIKESDNVLSEKLIQVYVKQGYYKKAISGYEKLSLKYPEKSDYFAKRIESLRKIINEQ